MAFCEYRITDLSVAMDPVLRLLRNLVVNFNLTLHLYYWIIGFYVICPVALSAQENTFHNITIENGLPYFAGGGSYGILQDSRGYIWLATNDGLCRYDGQTFRVFRRQARSETGISNDYVICVEEDPDGNIWVGTANGISVFDPDKWIFRHYWHDPKDTQSLSGNEINFIKRDFAGNMWVGTRFSGICFFDWKTKYFRRFPIIDGNSSAVGGLRDAIGFFQCRDSTIWAGTTDGLYLLRPSQLGFEYFCPIPERAGNWRYNGCFDITEDQQGKLWISSRMPLGRRVLDPKQLIFKDIPSGILPDPTMAINDIMCDRSGHVWLGTPIGAIRYDPKTGLSKVFRNIPNDPSSILPGEIEQIYEDREGNMWFLAAGSGYSVLRQDENPFQICTPFPVNAISPDGNGHLYLASDTGLALFDLERKSIIPDDLPSEIKSGWVSNLIVTSRHELLAGFPQRGYTISYNLKTHQQKRYDVVKPMTQDTAGNVWKTHAVVRLDAITGRVIDILDSLPVKDRALMKSVDFKAIAADSSGHIWIGSDGQGVYRYNIKANRLASCESGLPALKSLRDAIVYGIIISAKGLMYASTTFGLCIYDPIGEKMQLVDESRGLPSRRIYAMVEDLKGQLWIATVKGISRLDVQTLQVTNFDKSNGLHGGIFFENVAYRDNRGYLYFSSEKNLIRFHPDSLVTTQAVAPVWLNRFYLDHRPVEVLGPDSLLISQLFGSGKLHLRYNQNSFGFEFIMPVIRDAGKVQYFYQLVGYDATWRSAGNLPEIHYTNIDPGSYTFRARAVNGSGIPCTGEISILIVISPPWWATWWAYTLYGLFVGGIVYVIFSRQRLQHKLNIETLETEKLKEVDQLKSRFFANISHEFRTPLTLILGEIDSLKMKIRDQREQGQLEVAGRNARRLLELINQLLDLSKLEARSISLQAAEKDIVSFLKNIFYSMQLLADQKQIKLIFETDREPAMLYFDADKAEKIFTNLLSNAWKFTPEGGTITLSVVHENGGVLISVADTGIGIATENLLMLFDRFYQVDTSDTRRQQGTGIGLALVKELVELHHGEVTVQSNLGKGTVFRVFLPAGRSHLADTEILPDTEYTGSTAYQSDLWIGALEAQGTSGVPNQVKKTTSSKSRSIVLVVEDNPDVCAFITDNLNAAGHHTLQAANGRKGLELAREHLPDLIITDVMMPEMDGMEMSRLLRTDELTSHIPVIMLTARSGEEERIAGLSTGVDDYLTKPFNARELLLRVSNLINIRRALRKRFSSATAIRPVEVSIVSGDQVFLQKVIEVIEANISNEQFSVEILSEAVHISVTHLNRKLNALIDQSAGNLIRSLRMQRAAELLEKNAGNVSEIAYMVGFSAPENFSRSFKQQFKCTPLEYQRNRGGGIV